jgi:predicted PilT family ATPase
MKTFQTSFFDESKRLAALSRLRDPLEELAKHIDFEMFRPTLTDALRKAERKSLSGIHIATALELGASELITADKKMADAATLLGIKTKFLKKIAFESFPLRHFTFTMHFFLPLDNPAPV